MSTLRNRRAGRTLTECLTCQLLLGLGLLGSLVGSRRYGPVDSLLGVAGVLLGLGLMLLAAWIHDLLYRGNPYLPACRSCGAMDYAADQASRYYVWRCRCGRSYSREGRRFVEYTEEGRAVPYLVWRPLRGWREDPPA